CSAGQRWGRVTVKVCPARTIIVAESSWRWSGGRAGLGGWPGRGRLMACRRSPAPREGGAPGLGPADGHPRVAGGRGRRRQREGLDARLGAWLGPLGCHTG